MNIIIRSDQLQDGLIAQLVEHCTDFFEVTSWNSDRASDCFFSGINFSTVLLVYDSDQSCLSECINLSALRDRSLFIGGGGGGGRDLKFWPVKKGGGVLE